MPVKTLLMSTWFDVIFTDYCCNGAQTQIKEHSLL